MAGDTRERTQSDFPPTLQDDGQAKEYDALAIRRLALDEQKAASDEHLKKRELDLKEREVNRSIFTNPMLLAVISATFTLAGTMYVSFNNSNIERLRASFISDHDQKQSEKSRAFELIKHNEPEKALKMLETLLDLGLYHDDGQLKSLINARNKTNQSTEPKSNGQIQNSYDITKNFQARSNGVATYRECINSRPNYHFENWRIAKTIIGDGDAWFERQDSNVLCIRADASITAAGRNSGVDAVMTAKEVPN